MSSPQPIFAGAPEGAALDVDAIAEAMWRCRVRRLEWEELSEVGWKAEYRKMAQAAIDTLGLMAEYRTGEDGSGGVSYHTDKGGNVISTTHSGRSPTQMVRWVTRWRVFKAAVEYKSTTYS